MGYKSMKIFSVVCALARQPMIPGVAKRRKGWLCVGAMHSWRGRYLACRIECLRAASPVRPAASFMGASAILSIRSCIAGHRRATASF